MALGQQLEHILIVPSLADKGSWWENMIAALFQRHSPVSWLIRTVSIFLVEPTSP